LFHALSSTKVPLPCPPLPMYMIWHLRHQHNPAHSWLRQEIDTVSHQVLAQHCSVTAQPD
jgi:DNA-binding transcriptional LysR family regulator